MIDIHSHILPGIDDGAQTITDSLAMAQAAVEHGIRTIVATPHHQNGRFNNEKAEIISYVKVLNTELQDHHIPLTVLVGQESRMNEYMMEELQSGKIATINGTKYVYVEFASSHVPLYAKQILFDIQVAGYTPVIVHPERNQQIFEQPSILYDFVQIGALTQMTAASIAGKFGKAIKRFSHQLIDANLTHFLASDAHNITSRGFVMQEAFQELRKIHGDEVYYMFMENPQLMIDNKNVIREQPEMLRKKKFLGLF
ncbi:protein-tyrosine phosphatase [Oceanobacillus limi]|uniref:Tyrosine-protein phosphatase n=1 Tax=Oceanobacillus limi TaxID=930131 RepID=A0A1I0A695_9BACI|nr:CpsB/CapC family capsule biosynthesis tyrosine phosphatase [Oceanobacillus limi]SES89191.1 protein-tyrosine phosphatase [Oceanobacillus limi]